MKKTIFICLLLPLIQSLKSQNNVILLDTTQTSCVVNEIVANDNPSKEMYFHIWDNLNIKYNIDKNLIHNDTLVINIDSTDIFTYPLTKVGRFLSPYGPRRGRMHTGTDLKCALNDSILAVFEGKVRIAKKTSGYGNMVLIRHKNGLETLYSHLASLKVKPNDYVKSGDLIGLGGRTGRATTEHLHFETRILGIPFNSEKYIDFREGKLLYRTIYFLNNQIEISVDNFDHPYVSTHDSELEDGFDKEVGLQEVFVTIKKGDTLYKLSKKYNTTIEDLLKLNNLKKTSKLSIGQQIRIK